MKTVSFELPTYLAPYLLYTDMDCLTLEEIAEINSFMAENRLLRCTNVSENSEFKTRNDLNNLGADVSTFTFIKR